MGIINALDGIAGAKPDYLLRRSLEVTQAIAEENIKLVKELQIQNNFLKEQSESAKEAAKQSAISAKASQQCALASVIVASVSALAAIASVFATLLAGGIITL